LTPEKDRLVWKWAKGTATETDLGDPLGTTGFALCVYDAAGLAARATVPAGCRSSDEACWKTQRRGFRFSAPDASAEGVRRLVLKAGAGKAKAKLKGDGALLTLPSIPLAQPVTVQLVNGRGACFESVFSAPAKRNAGGQFRDKAD
jgi:hypothetical protein